MKKILVGSTLVYMASSQDALIEKNIWLERTTLVRHTVPRALAATRTHMRY